MQSLPVDKQLLRLYIDGHCTKEQLDLIRQYLHSPAYQESLDEWLHSDWQQVSAETFEPEAGAAGKYRQFLTLVQPAAPAKMEEAPVKRIITPRWWQVAAVFAGAIAWAGWQWQQSIADRQQVKLENEWVHLHNEAGKRTAIVLPDSSQVYLNAASDLRYNKNYGITNRNIILEGEAYFIVKHGGAHPFSVRTGSLTTVDIGTVFNIRYRSTEPVVKVAVAEGAVNVVDHDHVKDSVIASLTQQQVLNFNMADKRSNVQTLPDTEPIGGWRQGILTFHRQRLGEVATELAQYYGINIRFARPETADILITTVIDNATVAEALDIISITAGVTLKNSAKEVLIK